MAAAVSAESIALDQWRSNVFGGDLLADIPTVEGFEAAGEPVTIDAVRHHVRVSDDLSQHTAWLAEYAELGFDDIYVHHVGHEQAALIDAFGEHVVPNFG